MRQDDPDKIIEALKTWIIKQLEVIKHENQEQSGRNRDQVTELKKINKAIADMEKLGLPIHDEVIKKKEYLECQITPTTEETTLFQLLSSLQELINDTKFELKGLQGSSPIQRKNRPPTKLRVTFPNGEVICEEYAVNTMIKTLQLFGLQRVAELTEVRLFGHPLVSASRNRKAGVLTEVDGFFIETNSSTKIKAMHLQRISRLLGIDNIRIEVIDR